MRELSLKIFPRQLAGIPLSRFPHGPLSTSSVAISSRTLIDFLCRDFLCRDFLLPLLCGADQSPAQNVAAGELPFLARAAALLNRATPTDPCVHGRERDAKNKRKPGLVNDLSGADLYVNDHGGFSPVTNNKGIENATHNTIAAAFGVPRHTPRPEGPGSFLVTGNSSTKTCIPRNPISFLHHSIRLYRCYPVPS